MCQTVVRAIRAMFKWLMGVDHPTDPQRMNAQQSDRMAETVVTIAQAQEIGDYVGVDVTIVERHLPRLRTTKRMFFSSMQTKAAMEHWLRKLELPRSSKVELSLIHDRSLAFTHAYQVENRALLAIGVP